MIETVMHLLFLPARDYSGDTIYLTMPAYTSSPGQASCIVAVNFFLFCPGDDREGGLVGDDHKAF